MESIKISIFKNLYKSQDVPYDISLEKIFKRIKEGKSKDKIKRLREITNSSESNEDLKKEKEKIKKSLPCILFSGVFKQRNGNSLVCHSGLMITDFDKYENKERMLEDLSILKKNKHIVSVFISPSGNGIKAVVKIPVTDKQIHPKYFKEFQKKFNFEYWDNSNSNVDRVCFESYDPDIYINYNAEVFNPVLRDEGFSVHERVSLIPITNEDAIIDKIMDFNWKKDFVKGERNNYIFDIAGAFCEYGVSQYMAEGYIQNNITYGDFTENEVRNTVKSAYKKRSFGSKYFEDYGKLNRVKKDLHKGKNKVLSKYKISEEVYNDIKEVVEHDDFWYFEETKQGTKVKIDSLKYKIFLETNGFKKYYPGDAEKPTFVFIQSNKVSETSEAKIKDFVLDYLLKGGHNSVYKRVVDYQNLFSENFLLLLDTIELLLLKDTKEKSFIAFQNGVLEVTKDSVELVDYIDIDGYIWSKQIINRDFVFSDNIENDYKKFINNISNNEPLAVETAIGYLLSTYKNKRDNKAIILNDEVISDNPEGGTGKGLFVQGIQEIRKVAILDGKSFDDKKSFPYQTVTQDTQTLVFDDVKKNFDFESKFSLVTEGLTLERKNKDAVKLTVEESPKLVISTNYAIKGEGNSHDRRRFELEFAQYYGRDLTPYNEFKRELFDEWTEDDFIKFDNYMVKCIQYFMLNGLVNQNAKNLKLRKFIMETAMDFYEWIEDKENFPIGVRNDKKLYFDNFTNEYKDFNKWLKRKRFDIWIQKYAKLKNLNYESGITNGMRWFMIGEEEEEMPF